MSAVLVASTGGTSLLSLGLRMVVALGVVLLLMLGAAMVVKRKGGALLVGGGRKSGRLEVLARQSVSRTAAVTVVRCGERALVLGVTEQSVTMLAEATPADFEGPDMPANGAASMGLLRRFGSGARTAPLGGEARSGSAWTKNFVETLREKTVRR